MSVFRLMSRQVFAQSVKNSACPVKGTFTEDTDLDLTGKIYIVTGSTGGIGFYTAEILAGKGARVYISGRSQEKLDRAVDKIKEKHPNANLATLIIDLSDLSTIHASLSCQFKDSELHGLVHNAGTIAMLEASVTKQGHDTLLGTNVLGPQLVQRYLNPVLEKTALKSPAGSVRVVWVSSDGAMWSKAAGYTPEDLLPSTTLSPMGKYFQSKALNYYQSVLWGSHESQEKPVIHVAVHPGLLRSDLTRGSSIASFFGKIVTWPAINGAYTELFALFSPQIKESGEFIIPHGKLGLMRPDIYEAARGQRGEEVWNWLQKNTSDFYEAK